MLTSIFGTHLPSDRTTKGVRFGTPVVQLRTPCVGKHGCAGFDYFGHSGMLASSRLQMLSNLTYSNRAMLVFRGPAVTPDLNRCNWDAIPATMRSTLFLKPRQPCAGGQRK